MTSEDIILKGLCESSLLFFAKYIYKENHNKRFIEAPHFVKIAKTLEGCLQRKDKQTYNKYSHLDTGKQN